MSQIRALDRIDRKCLARIDPWYEALVAQPEIRWPWPRDTWLSRRIDLVALRELSDED
mgnify:CR=1 FL=1